MCGGGDGRNKKNAHCSCLLVIVHVYYLLIIGDPKLFDISYPSSNRTAIMIAKADFDASHINHTMMDHKHGHIHNIHNIHNTHTNTHTKTHSHN